MSMIEPVKNRTIQIHVQPLAQFIEGTQTGFASLPEFNYYKKNKIYQQRNQYLSGFIKQPIQDTDIVKTEFGKPHLVHFKHVAFNHSHSQNHYALAISQQIQDIGVDIEDLKRKVRFDALAKHAFHQDEYQKWQDLDGDIEYWFKVWTTKEAVLKASGLGIRLSLNELNTHAHPLENGGMCSHPLIGVFAYQNFQLAQSMLSIAWRSEYSCKGFAFPRIDIIQH